MSKIAMSFLDDDMLISGFGPAGFACQLQVSTDLADTNGWTNVGPAVGGSNSLIAFPNVDGLQNEKTFCEVLVTPIS